MSDVNPAAEAARENARTDTGQFGTQSRTGPNALQASPAERFEAIFEEHMDDYYFDELDEFGGYENDDSCSELITVRDTLRNFYESQADMPDFDVSLISDTSGTIEMVGVEATFVMPDDTDYPDRVTLSSFMDLKHSTTDRSATGRAAAYAIAEAFDDQFQTLAANGARLGLRPPKKY